MLHQILDTIKKFETDFRKSLTPLLYASFYEVAGYEILSLFALKAALVLSLLVSQVNSVCQEDAQCPGKIGH